MEQLLIKQLVERINSAISQVDWEIDNVASNQVTQFYLSTGKRNGYNHVLDMIKSITENPTVELNFYKQPFYSQHGRIMDANDNFTCQFLARLSVIDEAKLLQVLNDQWKLTKPLNVSINEKDKGIIDLDASPFILIRGWGNLIGTGGHQLSNEKAAKIQDDFRDWLIYKLTTVTT